MKEEFKEYLLNFNYKFREFKGNLIFFNKENGDVFQTKKDVINHFIEAIILKKITPNEKDEFIKSCFEKVHKRNENNLKSPFHIQWHINETCNLRCKHCYQDEYTHNGLSWKEMKLIVDKYFIAIEKWNNSPEFSITGGEPLMNPHLFKLLKYLKEKNKNTRIAILTNGTLLNKEKIKKFKDLGINQIQISLEGSTKEINDSIRGKGVYEKVISNIKLLKNTGIKTSLHFVISKQNKDDVEDYIKLSKKLQIDLVTFSNLVPFGTGENMKELVISPQEIKEVYLLIDKYAKEFDKENQLPWIRRTRPLWCNFQTENPKRPVGGMCPVGISTLTVLSNGDVMPCRRLPIVIGNLINQNFFEIWYGSDVLWNLRSREELKGCGKCKYLENCAGCRGLAYVYFKDYMGPDPQCWLINKNLGDYHKDNGKE